MKEFIFAGRFIASCAMVGASLCWASGSVITATLVKSASPVSVVSIQLVASSLFLWTIILARRLAIPYSREFAVAGSLGVLEPGAAYLCSTAGLESLSASAASLIFATEPAMVALLAWPILRERLALSTFISLIISITGVCLTLTGSVTGESYGALLTVCSTALASLYVVLNQRFAFKTPPIARAAIQQLVGVSALALLSPILGHVGEISSMALGSFVLIGLTGIIQYGLAFWLYLIAVDKLPVTIATLFLALIPLFTVLGGSIFIGEMLTSSQLTGAVLILIALSLSVLNIKASALRPQPDSF
jgi:drug/metabolite transporter (DMT)-like permease